MVNCKECEHNFVPRAEYRKSGTTFRIVTCSRCQIGKVEKWVGPLKFGHWSVVQTGLPFTWKGKSA